MVFEAANFPAVLINVLDNLSLLHIAYDEYNVDLSPFRVFNILDAIDMVFQFFY